MLSSAATRGDAREFELDDIHFRFLTNLTHAKTGIVLSEQKREMVYARLVRRLRALNFSSFAHYCDYLLTPEGDPEIEHLVNALTTNLTSFFREWHHFEHLRDSVLPSLKNPRLRLWSSACSSGMEPYSMAMVVHAALGARLAQMDVKILATDIDSNILETAMHGTYDAAMMKDVPSSYQSYFAASTAAKNVQVAEKIQDMVAFRQLNLLESWPMNGPFDAVFCRNVVIYFDRPTKQALFNRMADIIVPGGFLYIGHSENLNGITDRFELVGRTLYRRVS